jgi:hypothetical protein
MAVVKLTVIVKKILIRPEKFHHFEFLRYACKIRFAVRFAATDIACFSIESLHRI